MAQAGWYEDPENPARTRYWDGTGWTEQVSSPAAATPPASPGWGATSSPAAPAWGAAPPIPPPPPPGLDFAPARGRRITLLPILVVVILVAGGVFAFVELRQHRTAAVPRAKVLAALSRNRVDCEPPGPPLTRAGLVEQITAVPSTVSGRLTQGQAGGLLNSTTAAAGIAGKLPAHGQYQLLHCGASTLVVADPKKAYVVVLDVSGADAASEADLKSLGVPIERW